MLLVVSPKSVGVLTGTEATTELKTILKLGLALSWVLDGSIMVVHTLDGPVLCSSPASVADHHADLT